MRVTTVSILLVFIFSVCQGQTPFSSWEKARITEFVEDTTSVRSIDKDVVLLELHDDFSLAYLKNQEVEILRRLDHRFVVVRNAGKRTLTNHRVVKQHLFINYLWKVNETLNDPGGEVVVRYETQNAKHLPGTDPKKILSSAEGIRVFKGLTQEEFDALVMSPSVIYIGNESLHPVEESRVLDLNLNPNRVNKIHHLFPALNGEGITLSMKEFQYRIDDLDLLGRHVASDLASSTISNHATDMATIAAGAGNSFVTGRGVAAKALITSSTFEDLFPDTRNQFDNVGARLQNHSYGTVVESFYGALAEAYDQSANETPELLHVFSSGNQGTATSTAGNFSSVPGMANLTGNAKMAKNVLVVGAVDTTDAPVVFSSRGPAHDGRVKPELVAYSTAGTSNAAALVSGVSALLQQAYKNRFGSLPEASLLKGLLINSAKDVHNPHVDFATGFGTIDAHRALTALEDEAFISGSVSNGESFIYELQLPANAKNLKVTLVWNDPAASVNTNLALSNDLDLTVNVGGVNVLPWILNTEASSVSLNAPAVRGVDRLNNVEQVTIENPGTSAVISVHGFVVTDVQKFHVVYQWDLSDNFVWDFPTASDHFPYNGETGSYFYWSTTISGTGTLEYSLDDGNSWIVIKQGVDLSKGKHRWDLTDFPFATEATAIARMTTPSGSFLTDTFTIGKNWFPDIGFNCGDSTLYQWTKRAGVTAYNIYSLDGNFMKMITTVPDTFFVVRKSDFASAYFAVEPVLESGKTGLRSPSVNYDFFEECYVEQFTETVTEEGIQLTLRLGTLYGVSAVTLERYSQDGYVIAAQFSELSQPVFTFLDEGARQGLNRYRAKIVLQNGQVVFSDELDVYFITTSPFIIFPNPVSRGGALQVLSREVGDEAAVMELFQNDGAIALSVSIASDREFVSLSLLSPGIYHYRITSRQGIFRGKIFIY